MVISSLLLLVRLWSVFARLAADRNLTSFPLECPSGTLDGCTRVTMNAGCNRAFELDGREAIVFAQSQDLGAEL